MSNTNFYKGFNLAHSYKLYREEVKYLESLICYTREEEDSGQIPYWLRHDYTSIRDTAIRTIGYIRCLWDFEVIEEDALEEFYYAYSLMAREAEERIDELSEEE